MIPSNLTRDALVDSGVKRLRHGEQCDNRGTSSVSPLDAAKAMNPCQRPASQLKVMRAQASASFARTRPIYRRRNPSVKVICHSIATFVAIHFLVTMRYQ